MTEPELPPEPDQPPRALPPPLPASDPYPLVDVDPTDGDAVRRALIGLVAGYGVDLQQLDDLDDEGRVQVIVYTNDDDVRRTAIAYLTNPAARDT